MAVPRPRGTPVPGAATPDFVAGVLRSGVGDQNLAPRGVGHGVFADGEPVGARDSVYAMVRPTTTGEQVVAHKLGRVPKWAKVFEVAVGSAGDSIRVQSVNKSLWTDSTIRVTVSLVSGSLAGSTLTLEIGG